MLVRFWYFLDLSPYRNRRHVPSISHVLFPSYSFCPLSLLLLLLCFRRYCGHGSVKLNKTGRSHLIFYAYFAVAYFYILQNVKLMYLCSLSWFYFCGVFSCLLMSLLSYAFTLQLQNELSTFISLSFLFRYNWRKRKPSPDKFQSWVSRSVKCFADSLVPQ